MEILLKLIKFTQITLTEAQIFPVSGANPVGGNRPSRGTRGNVISVNVLKIEAVLLALLLNDVGHVGVVNAKQILTVDLIQKDGILPFGVLNHLLVFFLLTLYLSPKNFQSLFLGSTLTAVLIVRILKADPVHDVVHPSHVGGIGLLNLPGLALIISQILLSHKRRASRSGHQILPPNLGHEGVYILSQQNVSDLFSLSPLLGFLFLSLYLSHQFGVHIELAVVLQKAAQFILHSVKSVQL